MEIDQIIGIWLKNKELIRILKFEDNVKNQSKCRNLSERGESIKILKFEDKVGNQSKCWNMSANGQIDQNVKIWVKRQ